MTLTAGSVSGAEPARGQILSINNNQALFTLLGTTYGGNGQMTFALPNLQGMAPNGLTCAICMFGSHPSRNSAREPGHASAAARSAVRER